MSRCSGSIRSARRCSRRRLIELTEHGRSTGYRRFACCDLKQGSMPMRQGGRLAMSSSSWRVVLQVAPARAYPVHPRRAPQRRSLQGRFQPFTIAMTSPSRKTSELMKRFASPSWHFVADNCNPCGSRLAWDGDVPFIRLASLKKHLSFPLQPLTLAHAPRSSCREATLRCHNRW
jgi:hypothetical protein